MKRRTVFSGLAGTFLSGILSHRLALADKASPPETSSLIPVSLSERFELSTEAPEVDVSKEAKSSGDLIDLPQQMSPLRLRWGVLYLNRGKNLTAQVNFDISYVKNIDFWISAAIFDQYQRLLGANNHRESLEVNGGFIERNSKTITLDFGKSAAFERVKYAAFSISDANV